MSYRVSHYKIYYHLFVNAIYGYCFLFLGVILLSVIEGSIGLFILETSVLTLGYIIVLMRSFFGIGEYKKENIEKSIVQQYKFKNEPMWVCHEHTTDTRTYPTLEQLLGPNWSEYHYKIDYTDESGETSKIDAPGDFDFSDYEVSVDMDKFIYSFKTEKGRRKRVLAFYGGLKSDKIEAMTKLIKKRNYPLEFTYYKRCQILVEVNLVEGFDYPPEFVKIFLAIRDMV